MGAIPGLNTLKPIQTSKYRERFKSMKEEEEQPLSPMARLFHEPGSNVYIITALGTKTKINPDVLKANLVHTMLKQPRFSSLQVEDKENGRMKWIPTKVNIDDHIIVPKLDPNMKSPDKFVEDYMSNLSKSAIEGSKPLWDLHLLDLKTSDAEGTGVFRFHHSLGDGMSLMTLLFACTRKVSDPDALPTLLGNKESRHMDVTRFWSGFWVFWNSFVSVVMFAMTALFLKDTETPIKGPPGVEHRPRRFVQRIVSLDDIKLVKNAMNVTMNDVVLGVTQAGLSRYLNRRYGETENIVDGAVEKKIDVPRNIRLRATFFFNLRPTTRINAVVDMMKNGMSLARWGNEIGYVLLPFTIGLQDDPLDYIREAKAVID